MYLVSFTRVAFNIPIKSLLKRLASKDENKLYIPTQYFYGKNLSLPPPPPPPRFERIKITYSTPNCESINLLSSIYPPKLMKVNQER